jgi:hypothetical protein
MMNVFWKRTPLGTLSSWILYRANLPNGGWYQISVRNDEVTAISLAHPNGRQCNYRHPSFATAKQHGERWVERKLTGG